MSGRTIAARAAVAAIAVLPLSLCACTMSATSDFSPLTEQDLHHTAALIDRRVLEEGQVLRDPALDAYLAGVTGRLLATAGLRPDTVRVRVLRNPVLGASALANGVIHIHTGMLARLDNEAQLATLLGHELEHYLGRHAVREMNLAANPALAANASPAARDVADAALIRFERDLEREADDAGVRRMSAAGYAPAEAIKFFEHLLADEIEARITEDEMRGNHPAAGERLSRCRRQVEQLAAAGAPGEVGRDAYEHAIADMLLENARMDLEMGHHRGARDAVARHRRVRPHSEAALRVERALDGRS
jgi:predicted Zn-dependent protease